LIDCLTSSEYYFNCIHEDMMVIIRSMLIFHWGSDFYSTDNIEAFFYMSDLHTDH
jgi:hypothetical protein